jgi:putative aldouronate transport system permease protein
MIEVIDTYAYTLGIQEGDLSFSTAVGIFKSTVSVCLLFTANYLSKKIATCAVVCTNK